MARSASRLGSSVISQPVSVLPDPKNCLPGRWLQTQHDGWHGCSHLASQLGWQQSWQLTKHHGWYQTKRRAQHHTQHLAQQVTQHFAQHRAKHQIIIPLRGNASLVPSLKSRFFGHFFSVTHFFIWSSVSIKIEEMSDVWILAICSLVIVVSPKPGHFWRRNR